MTEESVVEFRTILFLNNKRLTKIAFSEIMTVVHEVSF